MGGIVCLMKKILIIRTYPSILDPEGYNIQEIGLAKALVRAGFLCDVVLYNAGNPDEVRQIPVSGTVAGLVKVYMRHGFGILKNGFFPGLNHIVKDYEYYSLLYAFIIMSKNHIL